MSLVPLTLLSAVMLFSPLSARADPDPLSAYRWKHRLLVVYVPDTEAGRTTLDLERVFDLIDSMPMRRAEMPRR